MLNIDVATLAPEMWHCTDYGVIGRAKSAGLWQQTLWHIRDFSERKDKRVDDRAYGGGPGMVLSAPPLRRCLSHILAQHRQRPMIVQLDPAGEPLTAEWTRRLAQAPGLLLICGRYEGIDARITESFVDVSLSIGPYVLSGGDLPGMCLVDGVVRQIPGALGNQDSADQDSYAHGLLDHPHYTRPSRDILGDVPAVLTDGHHADITQWRRQMALGRTWAHQPTQLQGQSLSEEDIRLLRDFMQKHRYHP